MVNCDVFMESHIDMMRDNPEGWHASGNNLKTLKDMEQAGICYEIDGYWYLQDEYLEAV